VVDDDHDHVRLGEAALTNMRHEAAADVVQRPMRHGLRAAGLLARIDDALIELRLGLAPALEAAQCAGTEDVLAILPARRRGELGCEQRACAQRPSAVYHPSINLVLAIRSPSGNRSMAISACRHCSFAGLAAGLHLSGRRPFDTGAGRKLKIGHAAHADT